MPLPQHVHMGAFDRAMKSLGFDGRPAIRSLTYVTPRFGDGPDDFTHALDVATAAGATVRIPLTAGPLPEASR